MIYFIKAGNAHCKIGTTENLARRIKEIRAGTPLKCVVLAVLEGSYSSEAALHSLFKHLRLNNEWFRLTDELKWFTRAIEENPTLINIKSIYMKSQEMRLLCKSKRLGSQHKLSKRISKIKKGA
jgi:hypothetical protein